MNYLKKAVMALLCHMIALSVYAQSKSEEGYMQSRWAKKVNSARPLNEYPNPQLERSNWTNLNGSWQYSISEKHGEKPSDFNGKILVPYPIESSLSGVKKALLPTELLWYKRMIAKPIVKTDERVILHFGAVDWQATVYLNGKKIGSHTGGYTAFSFDITENLKSGDNELVVKVYDPTNQGVGPHGKQTLNPENIYYTPSSGIWQTVWMEVVPARYISGLTITPDIDKSVVNVTVNSAQNTDVSLEVSGKRIQGKSNKQITVPVTNVRLWSPDDPFLYNLNVTLGKDKVKSYFGMRKVSIQKDEKGVDRIFLNNRPYFNLGTLDQGFWPDGLYTAPTDDALAFDIKAIKAMGFNTIRKHIKVEPARWYYYADKIGILVWQDFVNPNQGLPEGAKQAFEAQVKETMVQLHNYPSITTWVVFNERWGAYDQRRIAGWVKTTDPTRLVNAHSGEYLYVNNKLREESKEPYAGSDMTDVHTYPNPMDAMKIPGKARVIGEFGGIGVSIPDHRWDELKGWGYVQSLPKDLSDKYAGMINKLKELKDAGLSASIYTQPFDVEGEENGLLTYDREIIKIPLPKLRDIHSQLVNIRGKGFKIQKGFRVGDNIDTVDHFIELVDKFNRGKRDSIFLKRLIMQALNKENELVLRDVANAFIKILKRPLNRGNLLFVKQITRNVNDYGFRLFLENDQKIDSILGKNAAGDFLKIIISSETRPKIFEDKMPDLKKIEDEARNKYGIYGEQQVWQDIALYHYINKNLESFIERKNFIIEKYPDLIDSRTLNDDAWFVFENSDNKSFLTKALKWSERALQSDSKRIEWIDTKANLLYRLGRINEAIELEKKALDIDPTQKEIRANYQKMLSGLPTWSEEKDSSLKKE